MLRRVMVELCVGATFVLDPRGVHAQTSLKALELMLEALGGEQLKHSSWAGLCTIPPCGNLFDRLPGGRLTGWAVNIWPGTAHRAGPCSVHLSHGHASQLDPVPFLNHCPGYCII